MSRGLVALAFAALCSWTPAWAQAPRELRVSPSSPTPTLAAALEAARDGDTIVLEGGVHKGPIRVSHSVALVGEGWPVLDGCGEGTVVFIAAPGVTLRGLIIRNSGKSLNDENSGVAVEAPGALIEDNRFEETLFGIYLRKAPRSVIRGNDIRSMDLAVPRRGDPIRVWYSHHVTVENNRITRGRDVVLWYSNDLLISGNVVTYGRYGLHFMYCDDADIHGNRLLHNSVGAFLMYSRRLNLHHNVIADNRGPSGYGIGLKDMDDPVIESNVFLDNRIGGYVDNSPREIDGSVRFTNNLFVGNDVGISLLPLVRNNHYTGNGFIDNQVQVGVTGGGRLKGNHWSVAGRGNYWSDYRGYDEDGDGIGDMPYRSDRLFDTLMDRDPKMRLFLYSPAAQAVDFAAKAFPLMRPRPKLVDTAPLMEIGVPSGLPRGPSRRWGPVFAASLGLIAAGVLIMFVPAPARAREEAVEVSQDEGPLIEVEGLTKRFGALVAVDQVSFAVQPAAGIALWGANGAGKTTVLRCLLGILPFEGQVRLGGHDVARAGKAARRLVGFVPQEQGFHLDPTVLETLRFYARLKRAPTAPVPDLLERLGLVPHQAKRVGELSGGLKQRLALAVALLGDPPLLLLDEPTANLDAGARADLLTLLRSLRDAGKTLVFSTHRLEEVTALADRVLVLEAGALRADVPPLELASCVGLTSVLHITVPPEQAERANSVLKESGLEPVLRGACLSVQVPPAERGKPVALLANDGIRLVTFELEATSDGAAAVKPRTDGAPAATERRADGEEAP